jgi:hypothetical protein
MMHPTIAICSSLAVFDLLVSVVEGFLPEAQYHRADYLVSLRSFPMASFCAPWSMFDTTPVEATGTSPKLLLSSIVIDK